MKMKNDPVTLRVWSGGIDGLSRKAWEILQSASSGDAEPPSIRLVRDYIQRGLLGPVSRSGKELVFGYDNLLRFIATRVLLMDGWNLGKIAQHLGHCTQQELETFLPQPPTPALAALQRIRQEDTAQRQPPPSATHLRKAAEMSSVQIEMRDALRRLGLPEDGPQTEALTLVAVAPWFQALVRTDRISRITPAEAEEIGRAVTASLLMLARRKEFRK